MDAHYQPITADEILASPSASSWLKTALERALLLDPVDAANDAALLSLLLSARADALLTTDAARLGLRPNVPR